MNSRAQAPPGSDAPSARARRAFMEAREVLPLLLGVLHGEPRALRRVLGARRGGRIGIALALISGWLATGSASALLLAATAHVALGTLASRLGGRRLRPREQLRLSLWSAVPPLLVAAALRGLLGHGLLCSLLGVAAGQLLLLRALRAGLAEPAQDAPAAGR